ncbi:MAG: MFS transporter [Desulfurivibrionaceae bacterium]
MKLTDHPQLALFSLLAVATSGFGQTFYLSVFGGELRGAFALSHAEYGALYSGATIISAMFLLRFGHLADTWPLKRAVIPAIAALAAGCLLIGVAGGPLILALGFLGIRFGGQGMISHLGMTCAGRYFPASRGKAVALAAAGIPLAEAILPAAAIMLMGLGGWRLPWLAASLVLPLMILPLLRILVRGAPAPATGQGRRAGGIRQYNRGEALRDHGFYFLLPAAMLTPFVVTALLFHQVAIATARGWSLELLAGAFVVFAGGHLGTLLGGGFLVDRLGGGRCLPLAMLPMAGGLLALAGFAAPWVPFCYLGLLGVSIGLATTAGGAIWPERYGVLHLGAIRSVVHAAVIMATAVAPVLIGLMLDAGFGVPLLAGLLAAAALLAAALAALAPAPA